MGQRLTAAGVLYGLVVYFHEHGSPGRLPHLRFLVSGSYISERTEGETKTCSHRPEGVKVKHRLIIS